MLSGNVPNRDALQKCSVTDRYFLCVSAPFFSNELSSSKNEEALDDRARSNENYAFFICKT